MGLKRRGRRRKAETDLSLWIDQQYNSREEAAQNMGIARTSLDRLCRNERRPSIDLALRIAELSEGRIPVSYWRDVPRHSTD